MRLSILSASLLLGIAAPALASSLGDVTISSALIVTDHVGEIRGKVALNGLPAALVTVKNGGVKYTTITDGDGNWTVLTAIRSNNVEASARTLDGQTSKGTSEAAVSAQALFVGPASPELFALVKGMLAGTTATSAANVAQLARLMDAAILHGGGWEYDERMVLLLLGCVGHIVENIPAAQASEQAQIREQLGALGSLIYKAVCRGALDGKR